MLFSPPPYDNDEDWPNPRQFSQNFREYRDQDDRTRLANAARRASYMTAVGKILKPSAKTIQALEVSNIHRRNSIGFAGGDHDDDVILPFIDM